jgi:hypothetical protein
MVIGKKMGIVLFIGMLAFMPLEKLLVSGLGPGDVFILIFIVATWLQIYRLRMDFHFPLAFPIWLIWVGSLIGTASGLDVATALKAILQEIYLVLFFITLANAFTERESFNTFVKIWAVVATVEAMIIIMDRVGIHIPFLGGAGTKEAVTGGTGSGGAGRAVGTFVNANAAGGYMMLTFFVVLSVPFPKNLILRTGMLFLYILGLTVGLTMWLTYWLHRQGRPILFIVGAVMLLAILVIVVSPVLMSIVTSGGQNSITFEINLIANKLNKRLNLWTNDMSLLAQHPLGIGPNVTASLVTIAAHSDYVAFLTERGDIGFIGLIMLLGEVVFWIFLAMRHGRTLREHITTGALFGAILGLCAMATVHETTHGRPVWMMFAAVFLNYQFIKAEVRDKLPATSHPPQPALQPITEGSGD